MQFVAGLKEQIQEDFPDCHISVLRGGGTNALFLLERRGILSVLKIAMISNHNASIEKKCLLLLEKHQVAPRLFQDLTVAGRNGLQMEYVNGNSLLSIIQDNLKTSNLDVIIPIYSSLGRLLANVHNIRVDDQIELGKIEMDMPPIKTFIDAALYERSASLIVHLNEIAGKHRVLLHGDFGYHNVIRDMSGKDWLIDWELAGLGDPRVDVANVLFWTHLHFPDMATDCGKAFMDAYKERRDEDFTPEIMHAFVVRQVWRIIGLVQDHFPEPVKREWNRRLIWALEHRFC